MPPAKTPKAEVKRFHSLKKSLPPINMKTLQKICRAPIDSFKQFGEAQTTPNGLLIYQDNGSDILAVAHLDTVQKARHFSTVNLSHDKRIFCPTVDDRMGVYTILHQLPQMDIVPDVLLTVGEEQLQSSALYFQPPSGKTYNWIFSFDRGGGDVVLYDYHSLETTALIERAGYRYSFGSYSDICELEHLRVKGFNFGVGMHNYHSLDAFVSLNEYITSLKKFERFYKENYDLHLPHTPKYNLWTPEDGFAFVHKPNSVPYQDTFTDEEIELVEQLEYEGIEFNTRLTPLDVQTIKAYRDRAARFEIPEKEPTLFEDIGMIDEAKEKTEEKKGIKMKAGIPLPNAKFTPLPSEDDPQGSIAKARKLDGKVRVTHAELGDLDKAFQMLDQEESKGKQTLGPLVKSAQREEKKSPVINNDHLKPRIVNLIPLGGITDDDHKYDYVQDGNGKWYWKRTVTRTKHREELIF